MPKMSKILDEKDAELYGLLEAREKSSSSTLKRGGKIVGPLRSKDAMKQLGSALKSLKKEFG